MGLNKTERELILYEGDLRAQKLLDDFKNITDKGEKRKRYALLKRVGIITPDIEEAIVRLAQNK